MAIPITIEGQKYFVTLPSLADFRMFKEFLASQLRRELSEMIPSGLGDDELKRRMRCINDECDAIDPFAEMRDRLTVPRMEMMLSEDMTLIYFAHIRHDSPGATLDWVTGLVKRCEENKPAAIDGVIQLYRAILESWISKKKEQMPAPAAESPSETVQPKQA